MKRWMLVTIVLVLLVAAGLISCFQNKNEAGSETGNVSYNFHIRPILSDKCFKCHGPDGSHREAGLRLDIPDSAYSPLKETKGAFALVPGKPDESELYKRITSGDPAYTMPTPGSHLGALTKDETELFRRWIKEGAKYEPHWAFIPPAKQPLPDAGNSKWVKNEIDHFILAKMKARGLSPNNEADKERLLKRVSFDITGLPPSEELMQKFLADKSADAYEKLVDALLAMPQYGERMAVHWMDVARYADSYGYQDDNIRTQWPWRDWVIHAFNKNIPYDQFITWQVAGDMLPDASKENILATGFLRNHKYTEEGGVVPEEYRIEYLLDKTKTFTKGILGITVECAQCHDHKYDPFTQKDYFSMLAFFNNTYEVGYEGDVSISRPAKNPLLQISGEERSRLLSFINAPDTTALTVSVMGELKDSVRKTYVLNRGVYDQPGEEVTPAAIPAVMKFDTKKYAPNRLGLVQWTTDKNNPLTARVFVNQIWQELFGKGLVKTSGDFGMQGELPSHPELLDWLAVDFMHDGWDIKALIKNIVLSATYRQSAQVSKEQLKKDPENIYLSRAPRNRLKAEFIRDMYLKSSGLLVGTIGGPSVKPYQPKGIWETASSGRGVLAVYRQDHGDALYRRGLYTFIKLTVPPPNMIVFDASNRDQCEVKRLATNTPLQALIMMNEPAVLEASRVLAEKLVAKNTPAEENIRTAFRRIVCRNPTKGEAAILSKYYTEQLTLFQQNKLNAELTLKAGEYARNEKADPKQSAALMKVISLLYNMEEVVMK
ncbi:MAG TPA: PSD1 and planctomycete cytochrome C domain-containing protein [Chitinophagaceae bacterium]|nr:PSD1 and planctomycete cytochrome C domain-containing protein [Chitinophagaceae bacterium]